MTFAGTAKLNRHSSPFSPFGITPLRATELSAIERRTVSRPVRQPVNEAPSCIVQRKTVTHHAPTGLAHPMERAWAAGKPALSYPNRPAREPRLTNTDPALMSLEDLIATQPKVRRGQSAYLPVETRDRDVPSEYAKARESGHIALTLDMPTNDAFEIGSLAEALSDEKAANVGRMTPFLTQDPDDAFLVESEKRSVFSGPLIRTRLVNDEGLDIVALDAPANVRRDPVASKALRKRHVAWLVQLWGHLPTSKEIADAAPRIELYREAERQISKPAARIAADYDRDPERLRFLDEELHAPHEAREITVPKPIMFKIAEALYHKPYVTDSGEHVTALDQMVEQELQEVEKAWAKAHPESVTVIQHRRGHSNWPEALASQIHIAEYVGSDEDILG